MLILKFLTKKHVSHLLNVREFRCSVNKKRKRKEKKYFFIKSILWSEII